MVREFETFKCVIDTTLIEDEDLLKELDEYENKCLKDAEVEMLLLLEISSTPTYHCIKCNNEVYPHLPSPVAQCRHCKKEVLWKKNNHMEDNITFEALSKLTFNKAHDLIVKMSLKKRMNMLKELDHHLVHCYEVTKKYNDQGFGKSLSPEIFYNIMGKIKHLEILQTWLYGIG